MVSTWENVVLLFAVEELANTQIARQAGLREEP
jgi:hypothetical protein